MTANLQLAHLGLVLRTLVADVRDGFLEISRHSLALVGLVVVAVTLTFMARPGLEMNVNEMLMDWLEMRQAEGLDTPSASDASYRSTATTLKGLPKDQLAVTQWLSRRYRVSPEPVAALVIEAWAVGERSQIPPSLILAIVAIESKFNPFTAGTQGAMGLMQIEPVAQEETLNQFGGKLAAFDPQTNLRIGARLLQSNIQQAGSVEEGLRLYGRSSGQVNDSAYVDKVMAEHRQLQRIVQTYAQTAQNTPPAPRL